MSGLIAHPLIVFAFTSIVVEITPGPNMAYLAALSLSHGRRAGLAAVAGIALGLAMWGFAAALGLGALIDRSRLLYEALRWIGVAYLLWLAWDAWTAERDISPAHAGDHAIRPWSAFRRGLITNILNPKAGMFYIAMLPEFISIGTSSVAVQTFTLSAIYVGVATLIHAAIVMLASQLQNVIATPPQRRTIRRILAVVLAAIAVWFAVSTKHA